VSKERKFFYFPDVGIPVLFSLGLARVDAVELEAEGSSIAKEMSGVPGQHSSFRLSSAPSTDST